MLRTALLLVASLAAADAHAATPAIRAGGTHTIALHADGSVRTWGNDYSGELGLGRQAYFPSPVAVQDLAAIRKLAAGSDHVVALLDDGSVWAWGSNFYSQVGDGTNANRSAPVRVTGLAGVIDVSAGDFFSIALTADGSVWTWGTGSFGELGSGAPQHSASPQRASISGVTAISAGARHALALKGDGSVWAWGDNHAGQLGDGTTTNRSVPVAVGSVAGARQVAGGGRHSLALLPDGSVRAWGRNQEGQLGDGTTTDRPSPVAAQGLSGADEIAAGGAHSAARRAGGVWTWGETNLADIAPASRAVPTQVAGLANVVAIAAGGGRTFALMADGSVWGWGHNSEGALGDGTFTSWPRPVSIAAWGSVASISTGGYVTAARTRDGRALAAGSNVAGQLGNGARLFRSTASVVPALPGVASVEASFGAASFAVKADGTVWSWGGNDYAELGDRFGYRSSPAQVPGVAGVVALSAGGGHAIALRGDGTLVAWGRNEFGQVGSGTAGEPLPPTAIVGLANVRKVAAGQFHSLALMADGSVRAWGRNTNGELGDGTTSSRPAPGAVGGLSNVVEVSAGEHYSAALRGDGTVWVWGLNQVGLVGPDTAGNILAPMQVPGLRDIAKISAANYHVLALARDGAVWAWGWNDRGQLGDGTIVNRATPEPVAGIADIVDISAKNIHSTALRRDGAVWAWGENKLGPLGDGTLVDRTSPVVALREEGAGSFAANDWFLDLEPGIAGTIAPDRIPLFPVVVSGSTNADVTANLRYRPQDVGSTASTFVFALAPSTLVQGAASSNDDRIAWKARAGGKSSHVQCALAQLNAQGQLVAVSAASLQAYVSGVLSAQGQAVKVLGGVSNTSVGGATFFVGYGPNGNAMLTNGTTRGVVSVPGTVSCRPAPPQTGWWYNPAEGGRGFSIEARGNRLFMAAFHYDAAGRATWNFAGGATSLDGSLFTSDFLAASGGQSLTGTYRLPGLAGVGPITLAFSDASHGTLFWPGGAVAIERQAFVPNGLTAPAQANLPESGWWWNPAESGRGFFIEWQAGYADLAGYMYDEAGNPTWFISVFPTPNPMAFNGAWWAFAGGQSMGGPYRPATRTNDNVGSVAIEFASPTTATMTLPDGRRIPLVRQAF